MKFVFVSFCILVKFIDTSSSNVLLVLNIDGLYMVVSSDSAISVKESNN